MHNAPRNAPPDSQHGVPPRRARALFICGSLNQTTQMHAIARELPEFEARFTPFYGDFLVDSLRRLRLTEMTIGGQKRRGWCFDYLRDHALAIDPHGREGGYDVVITCTDIVVPRNIRSRPTVVVQEGIIDRFGPLARICHRVPWLPRWLAGTALTGLSGLFDRFCVASAGYRDHFVARGADPDKIVVTGIPNFDDCQRFMINQFPHRDYMLVCTSDARETFQRDDRAALVERAREVARGRKLIFKLHPNEHHARAIRELRSLAPDALVYASGSAEEMIANASAVLVRWSSTALVAAALGKELICDVPMDQLRRLIPIQNGGQSARNIARVCRALLRRSRARPIGTALASSRAATGLSA